MEKKEHFQDPLQIRLYKILLAVNNTSLSKMESYECHAPNLVFE